jgi:uncharacterized OB-fold protein
MEPRPTPETQPYWDGCKEEELRLQRCTPCGEMYFPPSPQCPRCLSTDVEWQATSGRGRLHTYVINQRPAPGYENDAPYAIAIVELDEGPRLMTNIVGIENTPDSLVIDMELEVTFQPRGEMKVPVFTPAGARR